MQEAVNTGLSAAVCWSDAVCCCETCRNQVLVLLKSSWFAASSWSLPAVAGPYWSTGASGLTGCPAGADCLDDRGGLTGVGSYFFYQQDLLVLVNRSPSGPSGGFGGPCVTPTTVLARI